MSKFFGKTWWGEQWLNSLSNIDYEISTINNVLYFSAYDIGANTGNTLYGEELWKSDGTSTGTYMVKDIYPGQSGSKHNDYQLKAVNSTIVFSAKDGINGVELWKTDGTETGTTLLKNINPDVINAQIGLSSSIVLNGYLYFSANNGTTGGELWKTDGTEVGTALVADLYPGADGSSPFDFTVFNGNLFFRAESESEGVELWSCVAVTSSISDVELSNNISVYPNPSNGILTIELAELQETELTLYNILGELVFHKTIHEKHNTINLPDLRNGLYTIHLKNDKGTTTTTKLIFNK
ncbi:MAG: T9SS type A sorting domain-containing protein [Bacteroidetes bacterium]|nr:T9SS type A sorting domain-containing protein [Bacteroidota bacterium]